MSLFALVARLFHHGLSIDELAHEYPPIPREQVEAAIGYYHANQRVIDAGMRREDEEEERLVPGAARREHPVEASRPLAALYLDEDAQMTTIVQGLTRRGVDVLTAKAAGMLGRATRNSLPTQRGPAVCSSPYNVRDYVRIHAGDAARARHMAASFSRQGAAPTSASKSGAWNASASPAPRNRC